MSHRIEMIFRMCLGIFNVPLASGIESGIFIGIFSVHRRAGLGGLVEDVLARVDAVIDDDLVASPKGTPSGSPPASSSPSPAGRGS